MIEAKLSKEKSPTYNLINFNDLKNHISNMKLDVQHVANFQQGIELLEKWAFKEFFGILLDHDLFKNKIEIYDINDIKYKLKALPKYEKIIISLLEILCRYGYINEITTHVYELNTQNKTLRYDGGQNLNDIIFKYPEVESSAKFLKAVLKNYSDVLSGKISFLNIMFPEGGFEIVESLYKYSSDAIYFNKILSQIVEHILYNPKNSAQYPLKIIEIGAGVGSTTEHILPILQKKGAYVKYIYSDISRAFTRYAQNRFANSYDFLGFQVLNIENSPIDQGITEQFDIVIATNVLHATKDILMSLKNVKKLLKPNGILIINEGMVKIDFSTLIYGLTDGWWLFEDESFRIPGSPFINQMQWYELLNISGFNKVTSVNDLIKPDIQICQDIILGQ